MAFEDVSEEGDGLVDIVKYVQIPRGITKQALGKYDPATQRLDFATKEDDEMLGIFSLEAGTAVSVEMRNYI